MHVYINGVDYQKIEKIFFLCTINGKNPTDENFIKTNTYISIQHWKQIQSTKNYRHGKLTELKLHIQLNDK